LLLEPALEGGQDDVLGSLSIHLDEVEVLDLVFLDELGQREAVHLAESESDRKARRLDVSGVG
jgi:predicted DNA-binding protein (UPF0251 family)